MSEAVLPQFSVRPGVCRRNGDEPNEFASSECRMTSSECDGQVFGLNFISGMDQWNQPGPYADCPSQTALLAMTLGQCGSVCSPNAASCNASEDFVGPGTSKSDCTIKTSTFGSCGAGECRWSPEHCSTDNVSWTFPDPQCTCDQVRVGACVNTIHNDFIICAVDEKACNPDISYYVPVDRVATELGISCSLCRAAVDTDIFGNSDVPTAGNPSTNGISIGGVAGALVAGCGVFVAAVVGGAYVYRRKYPPMKKKRTLPATVVSNAQAEKDDVSVL